MGDEFFIEAPSGDVAHQQISAEVLATMRNGLENVSRRPVIARRWQAQLRKGVREAGSEEAGRRHVVEDPWKLALDLVASWSEEGKAARLQLEQSFVVKPVTQRLNRAGLGDLEERNRRSHS
ncbi:MAG: hypothetical protein Q8S33_13095 [Myxococcales bacterium]|nr:hypothetical protein [Myxococcales bacterium]MDP3501274.1 hypothetical protein [Myxococcales bacterium]